MTDTEPVATPSVPSSPEARVRRPPPHRWLWYAMGGRLPDRHRTWVLHDTTAPTWWLRHLIRACVQMAVPVVLVLVLVPGPFWIRGMAALGGLMLGLIFSVAYMVETTENRVVRAGYPAGTASDVRERAALLREGKENERRRAATARRAARYRARTGG